MKTLLIITILAVLGGNPAKYLQTKQQEKTVETLTNIADGHLYTLDYKADYKLQDFIDSDLNSQGAVRDAVMSKLLNIPESSVSGVLNPACSAFQAVTPEGDIIYGRNFDYRFKDGSTIMMRNSPKKGFKSLSMVSMNFIGMSGSHLCDGKTDISTLVAAPYAQMDGMNEKGFTISVLALLFNDCAKQFEAGKHSVMTSVMMRMLLDRVSTVDQALEMLKEYNFFADGFQKDRKKGNFSNYHFLMSDAGGKTVVLEYILEDGPLGHGKWVMNVIERKAVTNDFLSEGWTKASTNDKRLEIIDNTLAEKNGVLTELEAMKLLDAVHQTADGRHESRTQWSVVYNLTKKTAKVCINHQYDKMYEFSLKHFKKNSCVDIAW